MSNLFETPSKFDFNKTLSADFFLTLGTKFVFMIIYSLVHSLSLLIIVQSIDAGFKKIRIQKNKTKKDPKN